MTLFLVLTSLFANADEGMWLPEQVPDLAANYPDLKIAPDVLADPTGPILGSVVSLGGCSGSFVKTTKVAFSSTAALAPPCRRDHARPHAPVKGGTGSRSARLWHRSGRPRDGPGGARRRRVVHRLGDLRRVAHDEDG